MTDLNEENDFTTFRKKNNPTYQDAFSAFKQRFLIDKKSIFNLDEDEAVLTKDSINYLIKNFVENGYSGNADVYPTFEEKAASLLYFK